VAKGLRPIKIDLVKPNTLLRARSVKLGNGRGEVEVLGKSVPGLAPGKHPLFGGIQRLQVVGLQSRSWNKAGDQTASKSRLRLA
jgi:hypothetical protein